MNATKKFELGKSYIATTKDGVNKIIAEFVSNAAGKFVFNISGKEIESRYGFQWDDDQSMFRDEPAREYTMIEHEGQVFHTTGDNIA